MIPLALIFVFGVWVLQQQAAMLPFGWPAFAIGLTASLILSVAILRRKSGLSFHLALAVLLFISGFLWAATLAQIRLSDALPQAWERRNIEIVGVVASLPQQHERGQRFEFDVERVLTPDAQVPARISLSQYSGEYAKPGEEAASPMLHAGERWQLTVRLKRPHGTANPHTFDFEAWAFERGIRATGYVRSGDDNRRLESFIYRPTYVVEKVRERIRAHIDAAIGSREYAGILRALAIGDDDAISPSQWQIFLATGTNHLISISGLHITMLSGVVFMLVSLCWRRSERLVLAVPARKAATAAGLLAALLYALVAGFSVPTQRTLYMLAIFALALWSNREISIARVLAMALLVVTLLDPWAVMAPGFWLSFGAVAVIAYALGGRLRRPHWLREGIATQWAVTLGLVPLLLLMFQQVSVVSPLANAVAIPVISLLVVPLTLLGSLLPVAWPLEFAHTIVSACMVCLQWLAELPASTWQQHAPPAWAALTALLGVLWTLLPRGFPMRWLGLVGFLPMFLVSPEWPKAGEMRVTVLDVGQGLAVVVRTANHVLLYDAGPRFSERSDSGSKTVFPYLRGEGVSRLNGFIISHDDLDHSGGAASILKSLPVDWIGSSLPPNSPLLVGRRHIPCFAGQSWHWDGVDFEMLAPGDKDVNAKDNNRSCVLKVTSAYGSLLLPGDIEREGEASLVGKVGDRLRADVLVAPHHGSKTSSTPDFVAVVHPQAVIFTAGYLNRFGHPKRAVVERYRETGAKLYRSDHDGAILLGFSAAGIEITKWRDLHRRYWHDAADVCAGCLAEKGLAR